VSIERQVPAIEVNVVSQQRFEAIALHAANDRRFAFPEVAVMDDHRIGLQADGFIQQRLAGGHAGDDFLYRFAPFHLEPVGGVITDGRAIEFFINQLFQFTIFHCRSTRSSFYAEE
jgi:hypothetical protein